MAHLRLQLLASLVSFLGFPPGLRHMAKLHGRASQLWSVSARGPWTSACFLVLMQNLKWAIVAKAVFSPCELRCLC